MTPHRVTVRRIDDLLPWRVQCTCGHYARWRFWSNAIRNADAHARPSFTNVPFLGGAA